jgi:hypothetical protein
MDERPLRLGDIVDDYCPRERRLTNHVVVALVGNEIRHTRCATCEAEHDYKHGRLPKKKRPDGLGDADHPIGQLVPKAASTAAPAAHTDGPQPPDAPEPASSAVLAAPAAEGRGPGGVVPEEERAVDGWLAHRPLIRASLPRTETDPPPARPIPEFTMYQRQTRGSREFRYQAHGNWSGGNGQTRQGHGRQGGEVDGNRAHGPGTHDNFNGSGSGGGQGHGHGHGPGHGHGQPGPGQGKRRRRRRRR